MIITNGSAVVRTTLPVLLFLVLIDDTSATYSEASGACTATAATLGAAREAYAGSCPVPRIDCDPIGGRWTCSSVRIGARAPGLPARVERSAAAREGGACEVAAATLGGARERYAEVCPVRRVDCDRMRGGWICASYRIGPAAPGTRARSPSVVADRAIATPIDVGPTAPAPAPRPAPRFASGSLVAEAESIAIAGAWRLTEAGIVYTGGNRFGLGARRDDANLSYVLTAPSAGTYQFRMRSRATSGGSEPPNDVWVRFGSLPWTKAYTPKPAQDWALLTVGEHDGKRGQNLLRSALPAGPVTVTISGRSTGHEIDRVELVRVGDTGAAPVASSSVYRDGDLLSLHHDSMPDADDLQAMITNRLVLDSRPDVDFVMVHGAVGANWTKTIDGSEGLARELFGEDMINAKPRSLWGTTRYSGPAVETIATLWQATLAAGDTVHVAEGGTSDVTALVLQELQSRGVGDLERIRVVQHSAGRAAFNERETRDDRMALVKRLATWVPIGNGNADNSTPDFNERDAEVESRARRSRYGAEWRFALDKIPSARRMDFSDTVELLHILGLPKSHAPDVRSFADRYLR